MKVLIQDSQSKKFFTDIGVWVNDAREAEDFGSYRKACRIAREVAVCEFNIILFSTLGGYLFSIDHGRN